MNIGGVPVEGTALIALGFLGIVLAMTLGLGAWLIMQMLKQPGSAK